MSPVRNLGFLSQHGQCPFIFLAALCPCGLHGGVNGHMLTMGVGYGAVGVGRLGGMGWVVVGVHGFRLPLGEGVLGEGVVLLQGWDSAGDVRT